MSYPHDASEHDTHIPSTKGRRRWPNNAQLALSLVVNVEEGSELSVRDGDRGPDPVDELGIAIKKPIRNYGNESNYAYGIKAGFPRIVKLLDHYNASATWTAAAVALERAPQVARGIVERGDEVCSHGWRWIHHFQLDEAQERRFIRDAVRSIEQTTGSRPLGWLSRYLHTGNTRRLLAEEGFTYHMDDYSDDQPFVDEIDGRKIAVVPYALDSNDMKFWTAPSLTPQAWTDYACRTFDWLYAEGESELRMMSLGLHLRVIGRPGRIGALRDFLDHVSQHERVWFATRAQIAQWCLQ